MHTSYIEFEDFEWFAVDDLGQLAMFTNAGTACFPKYLHENFIKNGEVFRAMELLPKITEVILAQQMNNGANLSSWKDMSRRGIYGYDYDISPPNDYCKICSPVEAINCGRLGLSKFSECIFQFNGDFRTAEKFSAKAVYVFIPYMVHLH